MTRIEALTQEATNLPKEQRLALARALLDLEPPGSVTEAEQSWDEEIRARIKAVDEGRVTGIAYEDLRMEMNLHRYISHLTRTKPRYTLPP